MIQDSLVVGLLFFHGIRDGISIKRVNQVGGGG
jgi:hypothetical protein